MSRLMQFLVLTLSVALFMTRIQATYYQGVLLAAALSVLANKAIESHIDPCSPNPCGEGYCAPSGDDYICVCKHGFQYDGKTCIPDACHGKHCGEGKSCVLTPNSPGFVCVCGSGMNTDRHCSDPCSPNPCGKGDCVPSGDSYSCLCHSGYEFSGKKCIPDKCKNINCGAGRSCVLTTQSPGYLCACGTGQNKENPCAKPIKCNPKKPSCPKKFKCLVSKYSKKEFFCTCVKPLVRIGNKCVYL